MHNDLQSPWWIPDGSPGLIGDPELWIDGLAVDTYARGDAAPAVEVSWPGPPWVIHRGTWVGAVLRFSEYPGLTAPAVYEIGSRRHDQRNLGRPYYVARWPD